MLECSLCRDLLFWVALKSLSTQVEDLVCWHCRGTSYSIFPLCVSLFALRPSSSPCIASANTCLPPRYIFTAQSPVFFIRVMKEREGRLGRWIKRGCTMKREWDTVLRQWHWRRVLMYKGIRLGAAAGVTLIWIFFLCLSISLFFFFFFSSYMPAGVCMCVVIFFLWACHCFVWLSLCTSLLLLQLLMRYVKMSTSSPCHGREPQLEKPSTTSVQLTPLVSHNVSLKFTLQILMNLWLCLWTMWLF